MPSAPDITVPPAAVAAEVARLENSLEVVVPAKGANIIVGTWNLRAFSDLTKGWVTPAGGSPKRNFADVTYISRFIRRCDVVAVQEVRGNLRALRYLLKALGDDWAFILTDVTKGSQGNDERLAFLFDTRRVKPSGLASELVVWIEDAANLSAGALDRQFARTPYAVSFLSSGQTFILVTLHVNYGKQAADRVPELKAIADWLAAWAEREFSWDQNLIALGDFNIDRQDDPLYQAFTSTGLTPATPLVGLRRTIFDTPQAPHYYDQIAWFTKGQAKRPALNLDCSAGVASTSCPNCRARARSSISRGISPITSRSGSSSRYPTPERLTSAAQTRMGPVRARLPRRAGRQAQGPIAQNPHRERLRGQLMLIRISD